MAAALAGILGGLALIADSSIVMHPRDPSLEAVTFLGALSSAREYGDELRAIELFGGIAVTAISCGVLGAALQRWRDR